MNITITTDASYYNQHKVGAYAFWISTPVGKYRKSGVFKERVIDSTDAEFKCILNALHYATTKFNTLIKIIVNTDSMSVVDIVNKNKFYKKKRNILLKTYNDLKIKLNCEIEFRHVKGHAPSVGKRNWVNNWCDKEAKKEVKKYLKNKFG